MYPAGSSRASPLPGVHCDQGRIPASGRGGSSSIARYSRRCPSGSRKYTAAAGIQPMTLGSVVSAAKNESGVTPRARRRSHAPSTSSSDALKATCNDNAMGADPSDQRPSIASPGSPIQKNAAPRSGLQRERQTDDVPVERHRPTQVAHREVSLEETADRNGRCHAHRPHARRYGSFAARTSTCSISGGSARSSSALPSRAAATAPSR